MNRGRTIDERAIEIAVQGSLAQPEGVACSVSRGNVRELREAQPGERLHAQIFVAHEDGRPGLRTLQPLVGLAPDVQPVVQRVGRIRAARLAPELKRTVIQPELVMAEPRHVAQRELALRLQLRKTYMLPVQRMRLLLRLPERDQDQRIRESSLNRAEPQDVVVV